MPHATCHSYPKLSVRIPNQYKNKSRIAPVYLPVSFSTNRWEGQSVSTRRTPLTSQPRSWHTLMILIGILGLSILFVHISRVKPAMYDCRLTMAIPSILVESLD